MEECRENLLKLDFKAALQSLEKVKQDEKTQTLKKNLLRMQEHCQRWEGHPFHPRYVSLSTTNKQSLKTQDKEMQKTFSLEKVESNLNDIERSNTGSFITLKDGRKLGYAQYGWPVNPHNTLLLFHGTPGSRHFLLPSWEWACIEAQVCVYVLERPGFGLSTPQPDRTLASFVDDVTEFVETLSIQRYVVLGYSAGAPYAAACALLIPPGGRLMRVGVASMVDHCGPEASRDMTFINRMAWTHVLKYENLTKFLVQQTAKSDVKEPHLAFWNEKKNDCVLDDILFMENPQIAELFAVCCLELYSNEHGPASEAEDYLSFRRGLLQYATDVRPHEPHEPHVPTLIMSGEEDRGSTPPMQTHLKEKILPQATLKLIPHVGHLFVFDQGYFQIFLDFLLQNKTP
eukprot:Lithocolla_globosa_v1_NODE_581_length_3686_cov_8.608097.p2 type:complete len:401 gc:universal NODE_581_length_3686_cov_8.608097:2316-3518(+)